MNAPLGAIVIKLHTHMYLSHLQHMSRSSTSSHCWRLPSMQAGYYRYTVLNLSHHPLSYLLLSCYSETIVSLEVTFLHAPLPLPLNLGVVCKAWTVDHRTPMHTQKPGHLPAGPRLTSAPLCLLLTVLR